MNMPILPALLGTQPFSPPAGSDKVNLLLLHAFHAIASERNFARAAVVLRMSQPPLVRQIRELEELIGAPLIIRRGSAVLLTPAGEKLSYELSSLFVHARHSIAQVCNVNEMQSGEITLGLSATALVGSLPAQLQEIAASRPGLHFNYQELSPAEQTNALQSRKLDVGFWYLSGDTAPAKLSHQLVRREPLMLALPSNHPLAQHERVSLKQLAQAEFIQHRSNEAYSAGFLNTICMAQGFIPRVAHTVQSPLSALTLIGQGLGITLLPQSYQRLSTAGVTMLPLQETVNLQLHIVWPPHPSGTAAARWLRDELCEQPA
ncbi:DNA-binding transcriptional LysR family regulator [Silvimonas terrae]|uniref:DNA-binding transcriptional LysR family regulator n=1 Tax=Silvimonas terrae TaxID=300266 RepID=A0A840RCS5_9NEIS|nr:LysR substrate-binding domain-containing protein [Silvimonas terrae]MBB5190226.1 DNA-binding transcriptional LysR family regulator [Silvimonas terrae]